METKLKNKLFPDSAEPIFFDLRNFNFQPLKKLTVILLVFLILVTPFARVFADDSGISNDVSSSQSSVDSTNPPADTHPVAPTPDTTVPPSNDSTDLNTDVSPVPDAPPSDNNISANPVTPPDNTDVVASPDAATKVPKSSNPKVGTDSLINPSTPPTNQSFNSSKEQLPQIDKNSGALTYSYPITIPPGRNKLQPDLKLSYNSNNRTEGSIFGYGWSINIPYIQRLNKQGADKLYSTSTPNYFLSSIDGELATTTATSTFISRIENGDFNNYNFSSNQWLVTDKEGTQYKYGYATSTQQNDSNITGNVYTWMLQEVRDTNNNYISYSYYKDGGQIYPSAIKYTGNGSTDGIFEVDFLRESRSDNASSSLTGFPVASNYRINEIDVKVNGSWVTKYVMAYTSGNNGTNSLLSSVTESGNDGTNTVTLPATSFTYQSPPTPGWTSNGSWTIPVSVVSNGHMTGYKFLDINGDDLPDIVYSEPNASGTPQSTIYLNNGGGWTSTTTAWQLPVSLFSNGTEVGYKLIDINGDGLPDIIYSENNTSTVYINNGHGWTLDNSWTLPVNLISNGVEFGYKIMDINGDGLPDIFYSESQSGGVVGSAYINNGHGWTSNSSWVPPVGLYSNGIEVGYKIMDINGDGLPDIFISDNTSGLTSSVYLNNGHGWTGDSTWTLPVGLYSNGVEFGYQIADINGDGLPDIFYSESGTSSVYINNGHGWTSNGSWALPVNLISNGHQFGYQIMDINGDGLPDIFYSESGTSSVYINNPPAVDLLAKIIYPPGGSTQVVYKPAAQYLDGSNNLLNPSPYFPLYTVYQLGQNDGLGNTSTSTNQYQGAVYYYSDPYTKKFAGYSKVVETDAAGNVTNTFFQTGNGTDSTHGEYQDNYWKIGKPYRVEKYDNAGHLFEKTINKWDSATSSLNSLAGFVKLAQTVDSSYDGDTSHKDRAESYTFSNTNGNQTQKVEYGQVTGSDDGTFSDSGTDDFTTAYTYASTSSSTVISSLSDVTVTDHSATKVKENRYYYDGLTLGNIGAGNQTKEEDWKVGSTYVNSQRTYNTTYGIVTQTQDPRSKQTNYSYDTYNLFPATVTDPLSHPNKYVYNYTTGKVATTTDPNGLISVNVYDGLGRLLSQKQPDLSTSSTLVTALTNVYTDTAKAVSVKQSKYLDASTTVDSYSYYDGLNRLVQTRKAAETANTFEAKDYAYNNLGLLQKESLPYFSAGIATTTATSTAALYTNYTYDALQRVKTSANVLGTTTNAYLPWKVTITDPNGKTKDLLDDAYKNLAEVDEHNSTSTYATTYTYDYLGDLTKITDALGNVRNFTYDGLGRRTGAEDLHASGDGTFGTYSYTYDDSGNLTQKVDPKSQTINYTYDDTNRQLTEDYTGQAGTEVNYTYDSCTYGIGNLCKASSTAVTILNQYNPLKLVSQSTSTLNSVNYVTAYTYDRQGNQLTIINPDNSQVKYIYNQAGLIDQVQRKESSDGSFTNVINGLDYSPNEQVASSTYASGVTLVNTYDPAKLYRLTHKVATLPSSSKAQDISYTYDSVGNITQIVNASATDASSTIAYGYDDLNRLISATANATPNGISGYSQTYSYDALGNLTNKSDQGAYSYAGNVGSNYANPDAATLIGSMALAYDNNGNLASVGSSTMASAWSVNGGTWQRRKQITIDHTKVSGNTALSNFPMLFNTTDAEFKTVSNGGYVASSTGADIFFTSSDGSTKLNHEIERYSSSTGETIAWVQVPTLSTSTDTTLYVYYGNASSTDQSNKTAVWDSNYKGVWHLPNGTTLSANDSTSNSNNGTVNNFTATTGQIGGGANNNSGSNGNNIQVSGLMGSPSSVTLSGWFQTSTSSVQEGISLGDHIAIRAVEPPQSGKPMAFFYNGTTWINLVGGSAINNGSWHNLAFTFDSAAHSQKLYIDGSLSATGSDTTSISYTGLGSNTFLGQHGNAGSFGLIGKVDEFRVSNTARSAGWIGTEYNNQSTSTFYSLGAGSGNSSSGPSNWYSGSSAWSNRKLVTINHTKVSGNNTLSNFPVLVSVTDSNLKTIANGGYVASSTGADILFTSGDGTTKLSHELESYSSSTGAIIAWVKVPTLATNTDTSLYIYFGNSSATNQQNATGTWDSNYVGVYHLPNGTSLTANDSTSNANNGTVNSASAVTGKVGGAASFSGSTSSYISVPDNASTRITGAVTLSGWLYLNGSTFSGYTGLIKKGSTSDYQPNNYMFQGLSGLGTVELTYSHASNNNDYKSSTNSVTANGWTYLSGVIDTTNGFRSIYLNGGLDATTTLSNEAMSTSTDPVWIGKRFDTGLNGYMDEVRISNTARSAGWIGTEYNNQSTSTMLSYGSLETYGSSTSSASTTITTAYTWDYNNRLTNASSTGLSVTSAYDPWGERVKYSVATGTTVTTYYPTKGYNITNSIPTKNIFANGVLIATIIGSNASATVYSVLTDHLTGSNVVTTASGTITELADYLPFGATRLDEHTNGVSEQRKFAGHEYDVATALSYQDARYYNEAVGRFISQDPTFLAQGDPSQIKQLTKLKLQQYLVDPQALNAYTYSRNNPLLYLDPNGQFWNPFSSINAGWYVRLGDIANSYAQHNPVFNYATNHVGVAYTFGAVGIAAGGAAGILYGGAALGVSSLSTIGSTCVIFCTQAENTINETIPTLSNGLQVGQSFGDLGNAIENESGQINDLSNHAVTRFFQRPDMSLESIVETVQNPLVRLQQSGGNIAYLSRQAFVVLNQAGNVVTWYGSSNFDSRIYNILNQVK